ncbi:hypothetical protein BO71DRAFT_466956 [Aspergillus ellipticus CBS 707.79]|uniref:Galactosyl transferase GMA12/MNN10 family protein n=1 Tax=Aspergillus ellipticus CBS 707.79 TaxID=1448320 RepID=A0A319DJJ7_9EURO|nr:hypothetical protein BO71DRAFT_466956 [Aspergillus ellipticus CBS 707.79]
MVVLRQPLRRTVIVIGGALLFLIAYWTKARHQSSIGWRIRPRVAKVTMLYGKPNALYERAIRSHQRHAKHWGYPMHVLREDIAVGFWNKPSYLFSLIVRELTKPAPSRMEWLMWVDADSIIVNEVIPVEIFLPPSDLTDIHLVAGRDQNGLNTGVFSLHVHPWTVSMLAETLGYPSYRPEVDLSRSADQEAMARVLNKREGGPDGQGYKDGVVYLPRPWINAYGWLHGYEGQKRSLLVHFPGLEDQRWEHMARWLDAVEAYPAQWRVPLEETWYLNETTHFWTGIRHAKRPVAAAEEELRYSNPANRTKLEEELQELRTAIREITDTPELLLQQIDELDAVREFN